MSVLISAAELADAIAAPTMPVVLDVRWALGDPHGRDHYLTGHVPGAVYVDLETELAAPASSREGRHPLPDVAELQAASRRWGIGAGDAVVVYDDVGGMSAARAWWLLRWGGLPDVRILDGGLGAWRAAGHEVEPGEVHVEPGNVTLIAGSMPTVDADAAAQIARDGVLMDARAGERYRGEVEPIDPVAGHIPGALSAPTSENLGPDQRFRSDEELRARFADLDLDSDVVVYCGSGVTAAHEIAALAIIGIDAALYPGSWSQWSNDPSRPVATGELP